MTTSLVIVNTGGANLASLQYAFERIGAHAEVTANASRIQKATHIVLPGVGAAGDAMQRLRAENLNGLIPQLQQPVLGICLGMHLLGRHSAEDDTDCLAVSDVRAENLPHARSRPVPHMGWNAVHKSQESRLLKGLPETSWFYFVHSFAMAEFANSVAHYQYGQAYCAVLETRNFFATQFHPERSAQSGQQVLKNFLEQS